MSLSRRRRSLQPPLPPLLDHIKDTPIKRRPDILLHRPSILRPQHKPRRTPYSTPLAHILFPNSTTSESDEEKLTFKSRATPPNRITDIPLAPQHIHSLPKRKILLAARIFFKNLLKLLRHKSSFIVICTCIPPMFRAVHVLQINPEQRVRKPARLRGQAEVDVYDERSNQGEDDAEAEGVETSICV
jgi:hypothetical protein